MQRYSLDYLSMGYFSRLETLARKLLNDNSLQCKQTQMSVTIFSAQLQLYHYLLINRKKSEVPGIIPSLM